MPLNQFKILNEWKIPEEFSDKLLSNFEQLKTRHHFMIGKNK